MRQASAKFKLGGESCLRREERLEASREVKAKVTGRA